MKSHTLNDLGFSAGLIAHLDNSNHLPELAYRCQQPFYCFSSPISKRAIVPIWECDTTLMYFNESTQKFEKCSLENIDDIFAQYTSAQSVLADLLIELYEADLSEDKLRSLATHIGFQFIDRMLSELANLDRLAYENWRRLFPFTCV